MDSPSSVARATSSLFAWYVVITSAAPSSRSTAGKLSVCVYRNSTEAGGGIGTSRTLLIAVLPRALALVVVEDRARPARHADLRVAAAEAPGEMT